MDASNQQYEDEFEASSNPELSKEFRTEERESAPAIAKADTRRVDILKRIVLAVLIVATVAAALIVYFYTSNTEKSAFEQEFKDFSEKMLESISATLEVSFGSMDVLAASIVSHARFSNQSWPTVFTPDYAYRAAKIRTISKTLLVSVLPVVEPEKREAWEAFSLAKGDEDVNETLPVMENDPNYYGPVYYNYTLDGTIFWDFGYVPYNNTNTMLPAWQAYPNIIDYYPPHNYDYFYADPDPDKYVNTLVNRVAAIGAAYMLPDPDDPEDVALSAEWADFYSLYIPPDESPSEPMGDFLFPIIDNPQTSLKDSNKGEVVAILVGSFYWRNMYKDILPEGADGVVVVMESECAPTFTYMINGKNTLFLGRGDLHEKRFDYLGIHRDGYGIRLSKYTGPTVDEDWCRPTFNLYPSSVLEDAYITNNPIIFSVGAVAIFLFTSLVFICYDRSVERRQKVVLTTAEQTSAVVTNLFPKAVLDRMYEEKANKEEEDKHAFKNHNTNKDELVMTGSEIKPYAGRPNCDLYPDTTIFFADIAGFTKWSSTRQPADVFTLLEALYGAFDKIAKKRRVFKVETIGDCYVAVTGLPAPMKNHATVMIRFAGDILIASSRILKDLDSVLGDDTSGLAMRVGCHSGATTAGVLRGDKGRFQLFGDTVNTASRMESNGKPGQIHVSQPTADLLIAANKGVWLTEREDRIVAKGKGEMRTFWVNPAAGGDGETHTTFSFSVDEENDHDHNGFDGAEEKFEKKTYIAPIPESPAVPVASSNPESPAMPVSSSNPVLSKVFMSFQDELWV